MQSYIHGATDFKMEKKLVPDRRQEEGCCQSIHTRNCCLATGIFGCLVIILGLLVLTMAPSFLSSMILESLALSPASARLDSWLVPPVQAYMTAYAFNITNPDQVIMGMKPILQEVGPFVYKAVTLKDSFDVDTGDHNFKFDPTGSTITYRPRKFYYLVSGSADTTYITVPNIPFLAGLSGIRKQDDGIAKGIASKVILTTGVGKPFINVSVSGLLWGYNDELPCFTHARPDGCPTPEGEIDIFAKEEEWDEEEWKRKKRSVEDLDEQHERSPVILPSPEVDLRSLNFSLIEKKKGGFVDCKCEWGLFRDRNVTLRKPVSINHGMANLSRKGWVEKFDNSTTFGWWREGSSCDKVGGQDGGTFPPVVDRFKEMDLFISLMCRKINLQFEMITTHSGLESYRFIPPPNALGSHTDQNLETQNLANSCYCQEDKGFSCLKSGVLNLEPCKASPELPHGAPIAISFPHFYQADQEYLEAVEGLKPNKTLHQFYVDIEPTLGFPLAIRPRFQLSAIIRRDPHIEIMSNFPEELVLPFLWAEDGFGEPSPPMASAIQFGVSAPHKLPLLGGVVLLLLGGAMLLVVVVWWCFRARIKSTKEEFVMS